MCVCVELFHTELSLGAHTHTRTYAHRQLEFKAAKTMLVGD